MLYTFCEDSTSVIIGEGEIAFLLHKNGGEYLILIAIVLPFA